MTVVSIVPEIQKKIDPPPLMPVFEPPAVYIPQPITPEIVLATPPPPRCDHRCAGSTNTGSSSIVQAPPPEIGRDGLSAATDLGRRPKGFAGKLFGHLNRYKRYPASARMRRQEGVVSFRFTMDRQGHVLSYEIAKTSGSDALDRGDAAS